MLWLAAQHTRIYRSARRWRMQTYANLPVLWHARSNIAYAAVMSERARSVFEARGRIKLEDSKAAMLLRSKKTHICLVVLGINVGVATLDPKLAAVAFQAGGLVDAFAPDISVPTSKRIGKAIGAAICGGLVAILIFFLSLSLWTHEFLQQSAADKYDEGA
jgi:hypothetical protein